MLYPLSYSREARQCIKGRQPARNATSVRGLLEPTKLHKFRACEGTLYRSGGSILLLVRARPLG